MRSLGKQFSQKGQERVKKSANQLKAELIKQKKVTNTSLAKQLGISGRTLRSYKKYFASLDDPKIKLNKNDRRPPKKIIDKISKIATKKKIRKTRSQGKKYDKAEFDNIRSIIKPSVFKKLKKESKNKNWFGWLIRVNILFITKEGSFDNWMTFVTSIATEGNLNDFIIGEIQKLVESKNSILGFEILEVVINSTLKIEDK